VGKGRFFEALCLNKIGRLELGDFVFATRHRKVCASLHEHRCI